MPSKMPGVGLPSLIGSPAREISLYLKPSGSARYSTPSFSAGVGLRGP
jgi:hypothetical protein